MKVNKGENVGVKNEARKEAKKLRQNGKQKTLLKLVDVIRRKGVIRRKHRFQMEVYILFKWTFGTGLSNKGIGTAHLTYF